MGDELTIVWVFVVFMLLVLVVVGGVYWRDHRQAKETSKGRYQELVAAIGGVEHEGMVQATTREGVSYVPDTFSSPLRRPRPGGLTAVFKMGTGVG